MTITRTAKAKLICLISLAIMGLGCAKAKTDAAADVIPTDGSQSRSQLAGSFYFCNMDSAFLSTSYAYLHTLTLGADGSYSYTLRFSDSTSACATTHATGGHEVAVYSQAGTFTVGGTAGTPSTGTKITYTVGSSSLLLRPGTYNGNSVVNSLVTFFNTCSNSPGFSTSADNTKITMGAASCGGLVFPAVSDTFENTVYNDGSTLFNGLSSGQDLLRLGGSTFPSSYSQSYIP